MNKIEELIKEKCPDGVEFRKLEDCCNILDKKRKPVTKSAREAGEYPYYGANGIQDYVSDFIFDGTFVLVGEDGSVITPNGTPVVTWATGKIWVNNHAHIIEEIEGVDLRYMFHYLQTVYVGDLIHGNIPKLNQGDFRQIEIAVPPIEIQQEIVRILDKFTELETGLQAELEARKKQYEYYRDALLTFGEDAVEYKMGDVLTFFNGRAYKQEELLSEGKYPVLRVGNFYTSDSWYYSDLELESNKYCEKGDLLYSWAATLGPKIWDGDRCIYHYHIWKILFDENLIDKNYLFYYLQYDLSNIARSTTNSTMIHVSMGSMKERIISIPSMQEQKRIVEILNRFNELCNDVTKGLPAEVEVRKKQYEHYRDLLLSFERLGE